jgi:Protein of unknown function (DUF2628)
MMPQQKVYRQRLHEPQVLKSGFCWPAFFFSIAWLLYNRLWSRALLWIGALGATRYLHAMLEAGSTSSGRLSMVAALAVAYSALLLVPGLLGNRWLERRLLAEGYEPSADGGLELGPRDTAAAPLAG